MAQAVFQYRDWIAATTAAAVMLLLAAAPAPHLRPPNPPQQRLIEVTLEDLPEVLPPPSPPVAAPQPTTTPTIAPVKPTPLPKVKRQPAAIAEIGQTVEAVAANNVEPSPIAPVNSAPAPAAAAPASPTPPTANPSNDNEERYVSAIRSHLEAIKRYPTSREARLEHPTGMAEVWFILDRNGKLGELGIEKTSGSSILDQAALSTVRRDDDSQFPAGVWGDQPTHRFTVRLNFTLLQ